MEILLFRHEIKTTPYLVFYILSRITFEVLEVAVKEVDIVEIVEKHGGIRGQLAEFVFALINVL